MRLQPRSQDRLRARRATPQDFGTRRGAVRRRLHRARDLAADRQRGARGAASAAASMPTPSIRASGRCASCSAQASTASGSRCTVRAARTARCRARSSAWACPTPAAACMGSAIGMDKLRTKRLAPAVGVRHRRIRGAARCRRTATRALERLGLPLIVKPATQGSSVGMTKVERAEDLPRAYARGRAVDRSRVRGAVDHAAPSTPSRSCKDRALPSIRIETPTTFYDYEAKYFRDDTQYSLSLGPLRRAPRQHLASARARGVRRRRRRGLGPRGLHDGRAGGARCCSRSTPCPA